MRVENNVVTESDIDWDKEETKCREATGIGQVGTNRTEPGIKDSVH